MSNQLPKLIVILGPTASGKTGLGIELAKKHDGEIISADSRQIYTGMDIGTAKPTLSESSGMFNQETSDKRNFELPVFDVEGIPHYLFDVVNPDEDFTVSHFKELSDGIISDMNSRDKLPLIVGGTGFYISSVVDNLSIPQAEPDVVFRQNLESRISNAEVTIDELYTELLEKDPNAAEFVEPHNPRRIIRALEIMHVTGKPVSEQRGKGEPKYDILQIGLRPSAEVLQERINARVDSMVQTGLFAEVETLLKTYDATLPALSGIGYSEVVAHLNGNTSKEEAIELIKLHTWQFAKRQMKWFKRDKTIQWIEDENQVELLTNNFLA